MARRYYSRHSASTAVAPAVPAYWETETPTGGPQGIQIGNYVVKHYPGAGKIQTYNYFNGPRYQGLSKGVTVNLDTMTATELDTLRDMFNAAIEAEKQRRVASAPASTVKRLPALGKKLPNPPALCFMIKMATPSHSIGDKPGSM